jgi:hypothetical protein
MVLTEINLKKHNDLMKQYYPQSLPDRIINWLGWYNNINAAFLCF